ncbi:MAG: UvrD-helicase domain-containing protein [Deltaproteobacteria bacterium]|jgi:DNA helicase-2/ATP-dependent DNA helicase PcrA|nr:UvrD-helicase domain-containing protein [Deltaproteobacteria bacterium]
MTFIHKPRLDLKGLLNQSQYEAATHMEGPLLIVAGAGSGKTRTLVYRVAWLIDQGIAPSSILLLTFTRKAAEEMLSRCEDILGGMEGRVAGGTFHALANSILRVYAPKLGFSNRFVIMDRDDSVSLLGKIRSEEHTASRNAKFPKRDTIQNIFSQTVNKDLTVSQVLKKSYPHLQDFTPGLERIFTAYGTQKAQRNLMDFDDLLFYFEKLLIQNEEVKNEIAARYDYILVDEYQDTNAIQARITAFLGLGHKNVTAVGDEAQSIYSFRGANFRNIIDFPNIYQGTKILTLEENYRSHPQILYVANHLLGQAQERFEKVLRPTRTDGPLVKIITLADLHQEAIRVADLIEADLESGLSLPDMAVLFRASSHSFELEAELVRRRLPYTKFGGRKFLESAHTKDFLSYLRLSVNPFDEISLRRVLIHVHGLGPKSLDSIVNWALANPDYMGLLDQAKLTRSASKEGLTELKDLLVAISQKDLGPKEVTELVFKYYSAKLPELYPDDHPDRLMDLKEFKPMAERATSLVAFLDDLTLDPPNNLSVGQGHERNDLTLSTVHSAKGLEWPRVYLISAVEGRFPSSYAKATETEEELRLMYVAVTRAQDRLVITMPLWCPSWGASNNGPTRFLAKIDHDLVELIHDSDNHDGDFFEETSQVIHSAHQVKKRPIANPRGGSQFFDDDEDQSDIFANDDGSQIDEFLSQDHGSQIFDEAEDSAKKAQKKSPARPKPHKGQVLLELSLGQKVIHPGFGLGQVKAVSGGTAIIDFEQYGEKKVMIRYSKLTAP